MGVGFFGTWDIGKREHYFGKEKEYRVSPLGKEGTFMGVEKWE
jgi:hypothetical protein